MNEHDSPGCKEVRENIPDYMEGRLNESLNQKIDEHLNECSECRSILEFKENKAFALGNGNSEAYDVKKIEFKFTRRIFGKLLSTAAMVFAVFYITFTFILPLLFNKSIMTRTEYARYAVNDLIQFTIPGAGIGNTPSSGRMGMFNLYSLAEFKKRLSGGGEKTGKIDLAIPAYIGKSDLKLEWSMEGNGSDITFRYPQVRDTTGLNQQWDKLNKLKSGTKCYIAAYFEKPLTVSETETVLNMINGEDFNTWLAIDTDNTKQDDYPVRGLFYNIEWGFPMNLQLTPATADKIMINENGNTTAMSSTYPVHSVTTIADKFRKEMKDFEKYSTVLGTDDFRQVLMEFNRYLASNEIKVKGAILSASTGDMLKLRDYPELARIDILKVDFNY